MSKWKEIRCNFFDKDEMKYYVDAWKTSNDNEEGKVIAKISLVNGTVEYLDEYARTDEYAQAVIKEVLQERWYKHQEQSNENYFEELNDY